MVINRHKMMQGEETHAAHNTLKEKHFYTKTYWLDLFVCSLFNGAFSVTHTIYL
jgi:hypothetical protein